MKVRVTLASLNPSEPEQNITILKVAGGPEEKSGKDLPETPTYPSTTKRNNFKMIWELVDEYGFAPGCMGCEAMGEGLFRRSHSTFCRDRRSQELDKTEEGKIRLRNVGARSQGNQEGQDAIDLFGLGHFVDVAGGGVVAPAAVFCGSPTDRTIDDRGSDGDSHFDGGGNDGALVWINRVAPTGCTFKRSANHLEH